MKKRNGFTLVELLITIAIMLSLLGIAMVSFINISNSKKGESWSGVKEQIKTAAEQYFSSNEYLINDIKNGGYAFVSVGTLVKNDYLNRVINPLLFVMSYPDILVPLPSVTVLYVRLVISVTALPLASVIVKSNSGVFSF